ncbi:hypothetical protein GWI33_000882 [Rhynchophorus ferrugineus]|uniref:DUF4817 domain-containing protein n=1 Tax=Rhynchophorus ferrugineus TaxID=354439 RepID=A0A834HKT3_RHYFE|nr:hypothetical protein GWI33_000882 [Rhynchophorus ferrugineus]
MNQKQFHSAPSETTIKRWFTDFKRRRRETNNVERCGRPNQVVKPENIKKIFKMLLNDRKVKLRELVNMVKISKERDGFILLEHLTMRSLLTKNMLMILNSVLPCSNVTNGIFASICDSRQNIDPSLHSGIKTKRSSFEWTATDERPIFR